MLEEEDGFFFVFEDFAVFFFDFLVDFFDAHSEVVVFLTVPFDFGSDEAVFEFGVLESEEFVFFSGFVFIFLGLRFNLSNLSLK